MRHLLGPQSPEDMTGAGVARSHSWQVAAGLASGLLLGDLTTWQLAPRQEAIQQARRGSALYHLALEVTHAPDIF